MNVHGTERILQLARDARNVALMLHVSTAYIVGRKSGALREAQFTNPDGWFSPYEQSKFEGEKLPFENGVSLPWVIARPSTIVGNSLTGKVSQFNYFHQLLRLIPGNRFPIVPGEPDAPVDLIPDDWVAAGLEAILGACPEPGRVFHLCAGPSKALAAQEVMELAYRLNHQRQPDSHSRMPRFVTVEEFQEFAKALQRRGETGLWRLAELLLLYLPHLQLKQVFQTEGTDRLLDAKGVVRPPTQKYLSRIIRWCL